MATWQLTSTRSTPQSRACVVFIHGFKGDTAKTWAGFPRLLSEDAALREFDVLSFGYESDLVPDLVGFWEGDPSIQTIADSFRSFAKTALSRYDALVLIAHSMGGLVVQRAVLDDSQFRSRVDKVILFGTPSFGLLKAWPFRLPILSLLNRQVRDMARGGGFITSLRDQWTTLFRDSQPFGFLAVAGSEDEFVPRSASIDGFPDAQCAVVPGNHLEIVKAGSKDDASLAVAITFVATGGHVEVHFGSAALALERREFQSVVDQFDPNRASLDPRALVSLALALDGLGRRDESMSALADAKRHGTDAMGVLAGRHKRNWSQERTDEEARKAVSLYREAYDTATDASDPAQAYYHAINLGYLELVYDNNRPGAREWADKALGHCEEARPDEALPHRFWRRATQAEAHLIIGDFETAIERYRRAIEGPPVPEPWQLLSTSQQALRIADEIGDEHTAGQLLELFQGNPP